MFETLKGFVAQWNTKYDDRAKLQHAYIAVSLAGIIVAGLVGLLNYDASRAILRICFIGLGIVVINAVGWALLSSFVVAKLPKKQALRK